MSPASPVRPAPLPREPSHKGAKSDAPRPVRLNAQAPAFVRPQVSPGSAYGHPLPPSPALKPLHAPEASTAQAQKRLSRFWQPVSFTPGHDVLGPEDSAWQHIVDTWDVPVLPAVQAGQRPAVRIGVKAFMLALTDALAKQHGWGEMGIWVDGSAGLSRMGCRWAPKRPDDLDLLSFVQRAPNQSLEGLKADIRTCYNIILKTTLGLSLAQTSQARLRMNVIPAPDGSGRMLLVKLGLSDDHVDARFVFTDERYRPYAFVCNAILFNLFDITSWATMPQVDAKAVLADIEAGVYTTDHALSDNSVMRAWKARARGLVPAHSAQDAGLFVQLARLLDDLGEYESLSVGYNLSCFLARELGDVHKSRARAQKSCALLVNAIVHTELHMMPKHKARLLFELRRMLAQCSQRLAPDEALAQVLEGVRSAEGIAQWTLWSALWAKPQQMLHLPAPAAAWRILRPTSGEPGCSRVWVPGLAAFVTLPPLKSFAARPSRARGALEDAHAPLEPIAQAAHALGLDAWHTCTPPEAFSDASVRGEAAQALVQLATALGPLTADGAQSAALAALHLSDAVRLTAVLQAQLQNMSLDARQLRPIIQHRLRRAEAAAGQLMQVPESHFAARALRLDAWARLLDSFGLTAQAPAPRVPAWGVAVAQQLLGALGSHPLVPEAELATLTTLVAALPMPGPQSGPQVVLPYLRLRALVPHDAHRRLRRLLRAPARAAQHQLHGAHAQFWMAEFNTDSPPTCMHTLCAVADVLRIEPHHLTTQSASRILTTLPHQGASAAHVRLARKSLRRMAKDPQALQALSRLGTWAQTLVKHDNGRMQTLRLLAQIACPISYKLAQSSVEFFCITPRTQAIGRYLLQHPAARLRVATQAAAQAETLTSNQEVTALLQRVCRIYNDPRWRKSESWRQFIRTAVERYGCLSLPASSCGAPQLRQVDVAAWLGVIDYNTPINFNFLMGAAMLEAHAKRFCEALVLLKALARRGIEHNERPFSVVDAIVTFTRSLASDAQSDQDPGLVALAKSVTQTPRCHREARPAAKILAEHALVVLVERQAFALAVSVQQHACDRWLLPQASPALLQRVASAQCAQRVFVWRSMLRQGITSESAPHHFMPLFDAMLRSRACALHTKADTLDAPSLHAALQDIFVDCRLRYQLLRFQPEHLIGQSLIHLMRHPAIHDCMPALLFARSEHESERYRWQGLWIAYVSAAQDASEERARAVRVARHNGFDIDAMRVLFSCTDKRADILRSLILLPLLKTLCTDPKTRAFDLGRWDFCAEQVIKYEAKYSWLFRLCQVDINCERQLTALLAFKLVKQVHAKTPTSSLAKKHLLQDGIRAMSYIVRALAPIDARIAALNLSSLFKKLGDSVAHDPKSCERLLLEFKTCKGVLDAHGKLIEVNKQHFEPLPTRKTSAAIENLTPLLSQTHSCDTEEWLDANEWSLLFLGLKQLFDFDQKTIRDARALSASWRAYLAQSIEQHRLGDCVQLFLETLPKLKLGHAKSGLALNIVLDALWDAQALNAQRVRLLLEEMVREHAHWRARPCLIEVTDKLAVYLEQLAPGDIDANLIAAANAWAKLHHRSDACAPAAEALLARLMQHQASSGQSPPMLDPVAHTELVSGCQPCKAPRPS